MFGAKKKKEDLEKHAKQRAEAMRRNADGKTTTAKIMRRAEAYRLNTTTTNYPPAIYPQDTFTQTNTTTTNNIRFKINDTTLGQQEIDQLITQLLRTQEVTPGKFRRTDTGLQRAIANDYGNFVKGYYDRDGNPVSLNRYLDMQAQDNQIDIAEFVDYSVSAVFLGMQHGYDEDGYAYIYEIGIFAKNLNGERMDMIHCERFVNEQDTRDRFEEIYDSMRDYGLEEE